MAHNPLQFQKGISLNEFLKLYATGDPCFDVWYRWRRPNGFPAIAVAMTDFGVFMVLSSSSGASPLSMDDDFEYTTVAVDQKQDLPSVPFFFPSATDWISRIQVALDRAIPLPASMISVPRRHT